MAAKVFVGFRTVFCSVVDPFVVDPPLLVLSSNHSPGVAEVGSLSLAWTCNLKVARGCIGLVTVAYDEALSTLDRLTSEALSPTSRTLPVTHTLLGTCS